MESGNAQLGFVARSQVVQADGLTKGAGWEIPQNLHSPIKQDAVLLRSASDCEACRAFLDFVRLPVQQSLLKEMGYGLE